MSVEAPILGEGKVLQVLRISGAKGCRGQEIDGIAMSNQLKIAYIFSVHETYARRASDILYRLDSPAQNADV